MRKNARIVWALMVCALFVFMTVMKADSETNLVKILYPLNADSVRGPDFNVKWEITEDSEILAQALFFDGKIVADVPPDLRSFPLKNVKAGVHNIELRVKTGNKEYRCRNEFYVFTIKQLKAGSIYLINLKEVGGKAVKGSEHSAFDTIHVAAVLQGLVNREKPQLFYEYFDVDRFWLDKMREPGGFLEKTKLIEIKTIEEAIAIFEKHVRGAVIWDENLPCTSHIASTICGAENLLPVRYDPTPGSMYERLIRRGPKLKVYYDLRKIFSEEQNRIAVNFRRTNSRKCDAYIWAKANFLERKKCNPTLLGYYSDSFWLKVPEEMNFTNVGLLNHDYLVAKKGFLFDLNIWQDEAPRDDPKQNPGEDLNTLKEILLSCNKLSGGQIIHIAGFVPWQIKYTNFGNAGGKHEPVMTEWECAKYFSDHNAFMDADAIGLVGMANASFYMHYPLPDRLIQNRPPTKEELIQKAYIMADGKVAKTNFVYIYLGDYDSAAWVCRRMPDLWQNPVRGQEPCGWAINPNLIERMPVFFDWAYSTRTENDFFIAGNSGAGYINPTRLSEPREFSKLKSGEEAWIKHCRKYYQTLNYSITGFILNGFSHTLKEKTLDMYLKFSSDGIMTQPLWMPDKKKFHHTFKNMPVAEMKGDIQLSCEDAIKEISKHAKPGETAFLSFRSILTGPDWVKCIREGLAKARPDCKFEFVDPYTYFYLLRHHLGGSNTMRATYTFDTMPKKLATGRRYKIKIGVRNDGWDEWKASGRDSVRLAISLGENDVAFYNLPHDVKPGQGAVVDAEVVALSKLGKHSYRLDLVRGNRKYFSEAYDTPWESTVLVN